MAATLGLSTGACASIFEISTLSGGYNNGLGAIVAASALVIGSVAARSYIKSEVKDEEPLGKVPKTGYKAVAKSVIYPAGSRAVSRSASYTVFGAALGYLAFAPAVKDVIYKTPTPSLGFAALAALEITYGIYTGIRYLKAKHGQKEINKMQIYNE